MTETWATLSCGASIFLCSEEIIRLTPSLFVEWITKHQITVAFLPTVLTEAFLDEDHPKEMALRCLYTGGDKLHRGPHPGAKFRLICCYGPCESTVGITACDVPVGMEAPPFNIGRPAPNVQILILDPNQKLLPMGVVGEMCIGGQQLARGYYNRPDLTKAAFIQNPFKKSIMASGSTATGSDSSLTQSADLSSSLLPESFSTSSFLYRSGDLARYLPDGSLEFWGRQDFQVKIRGNRIELGEIEMALREVHELADVVVVARTDATLTQQQKDAAAAGGPEGVKKATAEGEKKIVAYFVLKHSAVEAGTKIDAALLRGVLRDKLPEYMVPSAFVLLPKLPVTPNGKVDRDALPPPALEDLQAHQVHVAPRNEIEEILASCVGEVLGLPKVGMIDSFWEIGGHSLAAAQLLSRIRERLGVDLPLSKIFDTATMGALAEAIEVLRAAPSVETKQLLVPTIPGTPGSAASGATPAPGQPATSGQRSSLLAARMKSRAPASTSSAGAAPGVSPAPSSSFNANAAPRFFPSSPSSKGDGGRKADASPTSDKKTENVGWGSRDSPASIAPMPSAGMPRLGSSPSKSSGLANFLAHQKAGTSSRAGGSGLSGSGTVGSVPSSGAGVAVPFAAPTLGFGEAHKRRKSTAVDSGSSSSNSDDETGSPYKKFQLPSARAAANKVVAHTRDASVPGLPPSGNSTPSGTNSPNPNSIVAAHSPARFKKLARARADSGSSNENSVQRSSNSRRDSVSQLGTPAGASQRGGGFSLHDRGGSMDSSADPASQLGPTDAPMTFSQSSLHFINSIDPNGVTYTCVYGIELRAPFDPIILRDALHGLVLRHASLRTQFTSVADEPVQRVIPESKATLDFAIHSILEDLGHDDAERQRGATETEEQYEARIRLAWKQVLMRVNHTPFDIIHGPVFRARLFTATLPPSASAPDQGPQLVSGISYGVLHLMAHHIAVDGWSMELLVNELYVLYAEIVRARKIRAEAAAAGTKVEEIPLVDELLGYLSVLPALGQSMCERAVAERALLASADGERQWSFWQRTLAPPLTLLELHTDFPRPPIQTYKGDVYHFTLPAPLVTGLRSLAKTEKVTMFMLLFSSFLVLLHRYTGQEDVCIGTPMACRADISVERTVGHFVNPVVIRTNLAGDLTVRQLLDRIKRATINAFVNQDYPFPLLVDRLQSHRDASRNPLFQTVFSLNQKFQASSGGPSSTLQKEDDGTLHVEPLQDLDQLVSPFDLQLIMTETDSALRADLTYNTSLFAHKTLERMSTHLLELWANMVAQPGAKIAKIGILPADEYELVVNGFNKPLHGTRDYYMIDVPKPPVLDALDVPERARTELKLRNRFDRFELLSNEHCVHRLFELQTRLTPGATAVVEYETYPQKPSANNTLRKPTKPSALFPAGSSQAGPKVFTYAKLNERANSLAHYMREALGVRVGDVVVLLFYRCADWLVALLAALKVGATYVPVDPAYPSDRIKYMMADAKAKVLLTHWKAFEVLSSIDAQVATVASLSTAERMAANYRGPFPPQLAEGNTSVVMVDVQWEEIALFETINPETGVTLNHLCYLVYTSGSTGRPKGVMISHKALYLIARWHQLEYNLTEADRSTQQTAPAFDPVGLELWSTWMVGASLHIVPDSVRSSPPALQTFMIEHKCTICFMPTPIGANMLDEPWPLDRSTVPIRVLSMGGDRLSRGPLPSNPLPLHTRFDNMYGPSENTIISTFFKVPPGFDGPPPIGRVVDNVRLYVCDAHMAPVPIGVPGDIYLGGDALAVGYLNAPEKTAAVFGPDPFLLSEAEIAEIKQREEEEKKAQEASAAAAANGASTSAASSMSSPTRASVSGRASVSTPAGLGKKAIRPPPPTAPYPRLYASGDIGRLLPDGSVDFIGRKDFQVKIRGFRIELGEIETVLVKHPRVAKAVVQVKSKGQGHQALAAYVVLHHAHGEAASANSPVPTSPSSPPISQSLLIDELRSFSKQTLPEYMVPSVFIFLDRLPETANGKIDMKALPEPVWTSAASSGGSGTAAIVEPRNDTERALCEIWCNLLNLSSISIHDNFFELGGNSLTAARLLSSIKRQLGVELNVSLLFHSPTVAGVSDKIIHIKKEGNLQDFDAAKAAQAAAGGATPVAADKAVSSSSAAVVPLDLDTFDVRKEIVLDPSVCDPRVDHRHLTENGSGSRVVSAIMHHPRAIFLTGVTGFLGVHLLASLLHKTDATIYCLIRHKAQDGSTPLQRILDHAAKFELFTVKSTGGKKAASIPFSHRIVPVLGDLSAIRLGIKASEWANLASLLDGIIHCGAFVNSVLPYSLLKAANVGGTHEILRLATSGGKIKPMHYISTLSVFQGSYQHKLTELEPLTPEGLSAASGYPTSKYVADGLVLLAARRGLPVAIHRPGRITGHSRTGLTSLDDFFTRLLKGCVQLGSFPDLLWNCDLTPVDWMASSIVSLATHLHPMPSTSLAESYGCALQPCAVYHLHNPVPIHWHKLVEWIVKQHRYPGVSMSKYVDWHAALQKEVAEEEVAAKAGAPVPLTPGNAAQGIPRIATRPNVLAPLMTVFGPTRESMGTIDVMPVFNSKFTLESILRARGTHCPEPNNDLLQTYFKAFHKLGQSN